MCSFVRAFVTDSPFNSSPVFARKAGAWPIGDPFRAKLKRNPLRQDSKC